MRGLQSRDPFDPISSSPMMDQYDLGLPASPNDACSRPLSPIFQTDMYKSLGVYKYVCAQCVSR